MNPLELLKALEAIRDEAADLCCTISRETAPDDLTRRQKNGWRQYILPFSIHAIAQTACEAAYADMDAEGRASEGIPV